MAKVLIIVPYSHPSMCGVWSRAWYDAKYFQSKGYEVTIFSSNIIKGTSMHSGKSEIIEDIYLKRFPVKFSLGGTSMFWFFFREFKSLNPDIVHVHGYRHPHSLIGVILAKLYRKRSFITTHAPFEKDSSRSIILKIIDPLYDLLIGWWQLKLYEKVIRISNWEIKYLKKLGINDSVYIPNGISEVFTKDEIKLDSRSKKRALYMGRIDPVKRLEWMSYSAEKLPEIEFYIRGPLNMYEVFKPNSQNLKINTTTYKLAEFKQELNNSDIYILPSIREALPFTLLEAMSQGVIPLSSDSNGGKEVIQDGKNGFLFKTKEELVEKIKYIYDNWEDMLSIRKAAIQKTKEYSLEKTNSDLESLYNN